MWPFVDAAFFSAKCSGVEIHLRFHKCTVFKSLNVKVIDLTLLFGMWKD